MMGIRIMGTGAYAPDNIISNNDLSKVMDTNDEWIKQRTGISERRIATNMECSTLASIAAKKAIESASISPSDIDVIIVATCTPDYFCPSVACVVQGNIGAENAVAFDLSAACTGFVFAMKTAESLLKTGDYNNALVIGAEVMSKLINFENRNTAVLFGDGAGAAIIAKTEEDGIIDIYFKTDGKGSNLITMKGLSSINKLDFEGNNFEYGEELVRDINMEGREVFKFATTVMEKMILNILEKHNLALDEIKYIVPHQANSRIIDYTARKLKVESDKFYTNIESYANTSAASIPLALDEMNSRGLLEKGDKIILLGFGGGLSFGSALIKW
ncbi:MAG: beta-ketoacyl-ACP synthase III [Clostridium sp.]